MQSAIATALIGWTTAAKAEYTEIAPGLYDIGIRNLPLATARQHCEQWCWAASIETIFAAWGVDAPQESFVDYYVGRNYDGSLVCSPASDDLMLSAINSTIRLPNGAEYRGVYFVAKGDSTYPTNYLWWDVMVTELSNGRPLLAAYKTGPNTGHAVVVTHIRVQYYPLPTGRRPDLIALTVRDPWPGSPNKRLLSLEEVLNLRFIAAVAVKKVG